MAEEDARKARERYIAMLNELSEMALTWASAKGRTIAEIATAAEIIRANAVRAEELLWPIEDEGEEDEGEGGGAVG